MYITLPISYHEVKTQFYAYDTNAFIADVGGFLGLLLGHSALSLVKDGVEMIRSVYMSRKK